MVCGSRTITDVKWVETQIVNYLKEVYADQEKRFGQGDMDFIIIQGLARGVDTVDRCDYCLILWDGQSKGTKHDIDLCISKNKPHKVVIYNNTRKIVS